MRRFVIILLIVGSLAFLAGIGWLVVQMHSFERTEAFFAANDAEDGFHRRLHAALNEGKAARLRFYYIPDEFLLDGEYSESFWEGLETLIKTVGPDVVSSEITSPKTRRYFDQITHR